MRTLPLLVLLAALTAALPLHAQSLGEIRGRVFAPDGSPQISATVYARVNGELIGTYSDLDGNFVLKPLPPGKHGITISYAMVDSVTIAGIAVTDRATYIDDVHLRARTLKGAMVYGWKRKLIEREDPGRMSLLASEIAKVPTAKNPIQLVSTQFAGVTASSNGEGLHFRGSRTENMASFIDGIKVAGAVPRVPPSAISSVSVYTGGLPARYGDVTGGVVVIETKTYMEMFEEARARDAERTRAPDLAD